MFVSGCTSSHQETFNKLKQAYQQKGDLTKVEVRSILGSSENEKENGIKNTFYEHELWRLSENLFIVYNDWEDKVEIGLWERSSGSRAGRNATLNIHNESINIHSVDMITVQK